MNTIKSKFSNLFSKFESITNPIKQRNQGSVVNYEQYNLSLDYKHSFTPNELSCLYGVFRVSGL